MEREPMIITEHIDKLTYKLNSRPDCNQGRADGIIYIKEFIDFVTQETLRVPGTDNYSHLEWAIVGILEIMDWFISQPSCADNETSDRL